MVIQALPLDNFFEWPLFDFQLLSIATLRFIVDLPVAVFAIVTIQNTPPRNDLL
jgi:hypothetical protein